MAKQPSSTDTIPLRDFLKFVHNPDGTLTRHCPVPMVPPTSAADDTAAVLSKDLPLNAAKGTYIRLYKPKNAPPNAKLPLIIYFHGGGFVLFRPASQCYHEFCNQVAASLPALVVSVDYRLTPEDRLPAAYDDAVEAILWVREQGLHFDGCDPWLQDHADFSNSFLMGSSAGGNIAYFAGLGALDHQLYPITIQGLILIQPYFGGVERTKSELEFAEDDLLPLHVNDQMWELALPVGSNRDHKYCNPMGAEEGYSEEKIRQLPRCLVAENGKDPLVDKQREFVKMLERVGVSVVTQFEEDAFHGMELFDASKAEKLVKGVKDFVSSSSAKEMNDLQPVDPPK